MANSQFKINMMSIIKPILLFTLLFFANFISAQNKSGYTWVFGNNGQIAAFVGDTSRPSTRQLFWNGTSPNYPYIFSSGTSNISDSATGSLLLLCNGMQLFDSLGNIIENGDTLVPLSRYLQNSYPAEPSAQASIILPKGVTGEYYVFTATVSDTTHAKWFLPNASKTPFDMLLYHIVDMNANGGLGKVLRKKVELLTNTEMSRTNMTACRHSNGIDWWLLKKIGYDSNHIARFLVTKDSIFGPYFQYFAEPDFGISDATGQSSFSPDGKKYASVQGKSNKLFMADFDRCTGELSNPKVFNIPIDSLGAGVQIPNYPYDSISGGGTFSPNSNFFYISKWFNIYQFEYNEPDSSLAWYHVKQGPDTSFNAFEYYGSLYLGVDNRLYIGKWAGGFKQLSVIDKPDVKGVGCSFCRKCLRIDNGAGGSTSPPNMPNFNLGADMSKPCWPLSSSEIPVNNAREEVIIIYPNPASDKITLSKTIQQQGQFILYNAIGQKIIETQVNALDANTIIELKNLANGLYYYEVIFVHENIYYGKLTIQN